MDIDDLGQKFDLYATAQATRHTEVCERLTAIETRHDGLPKRVDDLEASRDRLRGGMWILGTAWAGLLAWVKVSK